VKKDELSGACSTHAIDEKAKQHFNCKAPKEKTAKEVSIEIDIKKRAY
jgi:hypothetical protein